MAAFWKRTPTHSRQQKPFYASRSSDEVKPAAIYLPGGTLVHVALSTTENEFFETYHIDKWGQKHQKFYGMIIAGRQPNPKHKRVSKEVAKEYLQHVDQLVLNMKKALRRKQAETKRRWKANGYQNLLDKQERANKRFMDARAAFLKEALVSVDGVYAAPAMVAEFSRLDCKDKALGFAMLPHLVATIIDKQVITLRRMQSKKQ